MGYREKTSKGNIDLPEKLLGENFVILGSICKTKSPSSGKLANNCSAS